MSSCYLLIVNAFEKDVVTVEGPIFIQFRTYTRRNLTVQQ